MAGTVLDTFSKADLAEAAYASVPHMAAGDRARYEGWLDRGGLDALQQAMPAWAEGSDLHGDEFRTTFFGEHGNSKVAAQAQRIGGVLDAAEPGHAGSTGRYTAGKDLADMVRIVGVHGMPTLMAVAARTAGAVCAKIVLVCLVIGCIPRIANAQAHLSYRNCNEAYQVRYGLVVSTGTMAPRWRGICQNEDCRAERDIQCAVDAINRRDVPNTMAFPTHREADAAQAAFRARITAFGREHPKRIALYCAALAARALHAATDLEGYDNRSTVFHTADLATYLDRPARSCSAQVLAVLPRTQTIAALIGNVRDSCYATYKDQIRCDRIRLPGP